MYFNKTPILVQRFFSNFIWKLLDHDTVYLTFDDGPIPEATPIVLDILKSFDAKATFFCVGENVERYPEIYQRILDEGHTVGNHTHNHLNGWKTDQDEYIKNVEKSADVIDSKLFRPPYGRIKPSQMEALSKKYNVIMWDVLSGDFDPKVSSDQLYENVVSNVKNGSIIVMHDNIKSIEKLKIALPKLLQFFKDKNVTLKALPSDFSEEN